MSAQTQSALQERVSQLKGLSVEATSQAAQLAALHADLQEVVHKVQEVEEGMECSVCFERKATTALNPCGHCFCCHEDSDPARSCGSHNVPISPCYRSVVQSRTQFFSVMSDSMVQHQDVFGIADAVGRAAQALADLSKIDTTFLHPALLFTAGGSGEHSDGGSGGGGVGRAGEFFI